MCIIKLCGAAQKAGATVPAASGNAEITVLLNRITQLENALKVVPFADSTADRHSSSAGTSSPTKAF